MKLKPWITLITWRAYCVDKEIWKAIDYLKQQVRVVQEQQEKDKRILLDNRHLHRASKWTAEIVSPLSRLK